MRNRFVLGLASLFFIAASIKGQDAAGPAPTPDENPESNTGALKAQVTTGGSYDAHSGNATRSVNDLHVPDALGMYGLDFTRYWNSLHNDDTNEVAEWPVDFGGGWSHSWRWTAASDCEMSNNEPGPGGQLIHTYISSITITFPDGHATKFKIVRSNQFGGSENYCGPPFRPEHHEDNWPSPGPGVHDQLVKMALDGSQFWLSRADGGSVHFVGYRATEVFDPHGFRTDLSYDSYGNLHEIKQEGWNRWLRLTWKTPRDWDVPLIESVEAGGDGVVSHQVTYKYRQAAGQWMLVRVDYPDEPVPGQTASAFYTYGNCFGDTEPCPNEPHSEFPLLKTADDPHYSGAMTRIRYTYHGSTPCPPQPVFDPAFPPANLHDWTTYFPEAIDKELSEGSTLVAQFQPACWSGLRTDYNGIGGWRTFYFGSSARGEDLGSGEFWGYALLKVTDYTASPLWIPPASAPTRKQNGIEPSMVVDGRRIRTYLAHADDSGSPSHVVYADTSTCDYDRVNPNSSSPPSAPILDPSMHNEQHRWLFQKKNELNQFTSYTRDGRRRVTDVGYPDGSSEHFSYNVWNQVTSHTLPSTATETYEYDQYHRLVRAYNSVDLVLHGHIADTVYTYDSLGRVAEMLEGRAASSGAQFAAKMTYNGRHQVMSVEYPSTDGVSRPTVHYEYDRYGNCTAIIDELGHRKDYTYDSYRRCTSLTEQVNACGVASRTWNWIYDRVIDYGNNTFSSPISASAHTSKEWRAQVEPAFNSDGERRVTARTFDVNNRITSEQTGVIQPQGQIGLNNPWHNGPDTEIHYFTYDENGQKHSYRDPRGRETTYEYDNRNWLWKTNETVNTLLPRTTETHYDRAGNKTLVQFPDLKTQQWENYDAFGQPRRFIDERSNPTDLTYWPWGPMKKLYTVTTHREMDGGGWEDQPTTFSYDGMGRPRQTLFPDGSDEFSLYEFGQLSAFKTRRNQTKRLHYDARGREDYHTWDAGAAPGITRHWDDANRLTRIENVFSQIDYQYDYAGQVTVEGTTVAGSGALREVRYCRYPSGEVSQITYPNGTVVNRNYTARGQLHGVGWGSGSTSYAYLKDGKVDYQAWLHGEFTKYEYDGRGMISSVLHRKTADGPDLAYREYWRDDRDRITAWKRGTDTSANGMENGRGDRYGYDEEGQLTTASYRATDPEINAGTPYRIDSFQYDALGNRVRSNYVASRGWMDLMRRNNKLNQYASWENNRPPPDPHHWGTVIYHDDNWGSPPAPSPSPPWVPPGNGVTMADGWIVASYNALNQPVAIGNIGYGSNYMWFWYDPLGRCVKRWMGDANQQPVGSNPITYFYYDGWNLIQEGSNATTTDRIYVHGGRVDEIVASWAGGVWYYHHYDARGHCILLTNASGNIIEQYDYDAFGQPYFYSAGGIRTTTSTYGNRFLFTGREWLSDLRIYDYRNRMYQPELGRFLQPDPKEFEAGDYNLYRYCHNDPINHTDPFGLIDSALLEKLKEHLKEIEKAQRKDHEDRTQGTKKDLTPGKVISGSVKSHYKQGRMQRDSIKTEELPERKSELAGTSHYHGSSRSVDQLPSKVPDVGGVKASGLPMLFGSPMLKAQGGAILIEPRVGQEPSQETISLKYDK